MEKEQNQNRQLIEDVKSDIKYFLEKRKNLFFNECDFQIHLAISLKESRKKYDNVYVEYFVPKNKLENYVWDSELYIDIVVEKAGKFCPIELKYKTKEVSKVINRFGDELKDVTIIKSNGAHNLAKYGFWKDVQRIELVSKKFNNVEGGLAIFLTNDKSYLNSNKQKDTYSINFSIANGKHQKNKSWNKENNENKSRPDFEVNKEYHIEWNDKQIGETNFYYCILEI